MHWRKDAGEKGPVFTWGIATARESYGCKFCQCRVDTGEDYVLVSQKVVYPGCPPDYLVCGHCMRQAMETKIDQYVQERLEEIRGEKEEDWRNYLSKS